MNENAHGHDCPNCGCHFADAALINANARIMDLQQRICEMHEGEVCPLCDSENTEYLFFGLENKHNRYACRDCGWAQEEKE